MYVYHAQRIYINTCCWFKSLQLLSLSVYHFLSLVPRRQPILSVYVNLFMKMNFSSDHFNSLILLNTHLYQMSFMNQFLIEIQEIHFRFDEFILDLIVSGCLFESILYNISTW